MINILLISLNNNLSIWEERKKNYDKEKEEYWEVYYTRKKFILRKSCWKKV